MDEFYDMPLTDKLYLNFHGSVLQNAKTFGVLQGVRFTKRHVFAVGNTEGDLGIFCFDRISPIIVSHSLGNISSINIGTLLPSNEPAIIVYNLEGYIHLIKVTLTNAIEPNFH